MNRVALIIGTWAFCFIAFFVYLGAVTYQVIDSRNNSGVVECAGGE